MSALYESHVPASTVLSRLLARFREVRSRGGQGAVAGVMKTAPARAGVACGDAPTFEAGPDAGDRGAAGRGFTWPALARGGAHLSAQPRPAGLL